MSDRIDTANPPADPADVVIPFPVRSEDPDAALAKIASTEFEPIDTGPRLTLEEWLERAGEEYLIARFAAAVLEKTPTELERTAADDPDATARLAETLAWWKELSEANAAILRAALARIAIVTARLDQKGLKDG
jgi:hypothetical protein